VNKSKRKIICIVGPTASGKTGLGVKIAKKFDGEIISADSRQVFRGLDIGTGKDLGEYGDVKYHLIDICDPGDEFNLFDWLELAQKTIADIHKRGKIPVIEGGTGLYVQALVEGFALQQVKSRKIKVERYSRKQLEEKTVEELQEICNSLCAVSRSLDIKNPHRLIRSIERAQSYQVPAKKKPDYKVLQIGIKWPKDELDKRIDKRVEEWFEAGFEDELRSLLEKGVSLDWLNKIGLEYRILANYIYYQNLKEKNDNEKINTLIENCKLEIDNLSSFESMKEKMKILIHQYAKRQMTWFKRFPEIKWIEGKDYKKAEDLVEKFSS